MLTADQVELICGDDLMLREASREFGAFERLEDGLMIILDGRPETVRIPVASDGG